MKMFTEAEIEYILDNADSAWRHNKIPSKYKQNFITTLKTYINEGGTIENVCYECLGTGRGKQA